MRNDAPEFPNAEAAIKWLDGKIVATANGSCAIVSPAPSLKIRPCRRPPAISTRVLEVLTSGFRAGKIDAAIIWEPTASRIVSEGLARRVATGNDFAEPDGAFLDMRADLDKTAPGMW